MKPLQIPYQAIPGNHDNRDAMRLAFSDQAWMPRTGAINWMKELVNFAIIGLDTSVNGASHGHLTEATLGYLEVTLAKVSPKPVIVAVHHPPVTTGIAKMDVQNLRDSAPLKRTLSGYQGDLRLVCGHIHRNVVTKFGNVICQISPGTSHAVTLDQREAAPNCLTREPGAFLLHEWRNGLMTHSIPIGQFDGPWMFYPDF
jgi:3',5'-cyclic-AMP phosphodiesterase